MKKLTFVAAALMATSAFAGDHSINLQGRMSLINTNRDQKKTGIASDTRIAAERADLTFAGKLTANTKYTVGLNLAASNAASTSDVATNYIDSVFVTRTLAEGLTLDIGKRALLGGGFEVTHRAIDQYAKSNYWTTVYTAGNQFGLTLSKELMGHSLMVQLSNGNKDRKETHSGTDYYTQSRMGWAAEWLGNWGSMVKSNVGYTVIPSTTTERSTNLLGAGLQFNVTNFVIEADYGVVTSVKAATGNKDKKTTSIVGAVAYTGMETLTPFVKVMSDTKKQANDGSKSDEIMAFGLGVEYKEAKTDAIRYHAVYTSEGHKPVGGTKYTASQIIVGAKIDVNVL